MSPSIVRRKSKEEPVERARYEMERLEADRNCDFDAKTMIIKLLLMQI